MALDAGEERLLGQVLGEMVDLELEEAMDAGVVAPHQFVAGGPVTGSPGVEQLVVGHRAEAVSRVHATGASRRRLGSRATATVLTSGS